MTTAANRPDADHPRRFRLPLAGGDEVDVWARDADHARDLAVTLEYQLRRPPPRDERLEEAGATLREMMTELGSGETAPLNHAHTALALAHGLIYLEIERRQEANR